MAFHQHTVRYWKEISTLQKASPSAVCKTLTSQLEGAAIPSTEQHPENSSNIKYFLSPNSGHSSSQY